MKREEIRLPRHFWHWRVALIVLILHFLICALVWVAAFARVLSLEFLAEHGATSSSLVSLVAAYQTPMIAALVWTPIFLFHLGVHLYLAGRSDAGSGERQAYREGFRDGTHYAADDRYDARRLEIDDDGELLEFPSGGKQKRR